MVNENIVYDEIRLIGADGGQLGIMPPAKAMDIAAEEGLDLVEISPQATPPVCKLMDYGKYRFEQSKREKEARKNQHVTEVKEIRLTPNTDKGDMATKLKSTVKFLESGARVKVSVRFRGREMAHPEFGRETLLRFIELIGDAGTVDKEPQMEGRSLSVTILPKARK